MSNVLKVAFGGSRFVESAPIFQWAYGQKLLFLGLSLPDHYEVHFSNYDETGEAKKQIGDETGVIIPDEYLETGLDIYAWIIMHYSADDGAAKYKVKIPIKKRSEPIDADPTPVQQDVITQAIALLNTGVAQAQTSAQTATEQAGIATSAANTATQAATQAGQSAQSASESASSAARNAASALQGATDAQAAKTAAETAQEKAEEAQDKAEQAAAQSGYMFFYINQNGDLIYQRTPNVNVDFYLSDGDLYVEAIA